MSSAATRCHICSIVGVWDETILTKLQVPANGVVCRMNFLGQSKELPFMFHFTDYQLFDSIRGTIGLDFERHVSLVCPAPPFFGLEVLFSQTSISVIPLTANLRWIQSSFKENGNAAPGAVKEGNS
jgi:hypothetical protein